jgi:hypothetical protein
MLSLLSIFLCGVVAIFVTNTADWKKAYTEQKTLAEAAQVQAAVAAESKKQAIARLDKLISSLQNQILALEQKNADIQGELDTMLLAKAQSENKSSTAVSLSKSLQDTIAKMFIAQREIQSELDKNHREMITAQTRVIDLERELDSERVKSAQLYTLSRQRLEQIHDLENENDSIRSRLQQVTLKSDEVRPGGQVSQTLVRESGVPISGQITEIEDNLAAISVGSSSGVRQDMTFYVYRNDQYLGNLLITDVEPTESVGRLVGVQANVLRGDKVTTGFD